MYSFPYLEPVRCSMSGSNCCFLTYIQISQEAGKVVWYSHLFKNFPQFVVIHTVKGFGVVNKTEVDVFLELSCFLCDPMDVGHLISGSSAFSKSSLNICKFSVYILLKPGLENFEHYFANVWDECNCAVVWTFLESLVAQRIKLLPAMQETRVRSLGWEDPLEKEMATHSSILSWRIPWTEEPGGLQSTGSQRVRHDWATSLHFTLNILWHCLSLGLERKLTFFGPVATAKFFKFAGILSVALSKHHLLGFEITHWNPITSTSFVRSDAS